MTKKGILLKITAKPGKEEEVAAFLKSAIPLVEDEPGTINWYGFKISDDTFGVFDTFPDDDARQSHLTGRVAEALMKNAPELLATSPVIELVDILASK
jgi:quinol monooxygenase YgiN